MNNSANGRQKGRAGESAPDVIGMLQFYYENHTMFSPVGTMQSMVATGVYAPSGANMNDNYTGVLVIAHGMREPSGAAAFLEIVEYVRQIAARDAGGRGVFGIRPADDCRSSRSIGRAGGADIAAVPMFLSAVGHTMDDVPKAVAEAVGQYNEGSGFRVQGSEAKVQGSGIQDSGVIKNMKRSKFQLNRMSAHISGWWNFRPFDTGNR